MSERKLVSKDLLFDVCKPILFNNRLQLVIELFQTFLNSNLITPDGKIHTLEFKMNLDSS